MAIPYPIVLAVAIGATVLLHGQDRQPPANTGASVALSVGDPRWESFVALRQKLGLPAKAPGAAAPSVRSGLRVAMAAIREGLHLPAQPATKGPQAETAAAVRQQAITDRFRTAIAADDAAVRALLALATTASDMALVRGALVAVASKPARAIDAERAIPLLLSLMESPNEETQRLAFAPLVDYLQVAPLSDAMRTRLATAAAEPWPPIAELKSESVQALNRYATSALPAQAFLAPLTPVARRFALAAQGGDAGLVKKLAASGADPRFILQCHAMAAARCDAETALCLFHWYSPHPAKWEAAQLVGWNAWQLGVVETLVAIFPRLPAEQRTWYGCLGGERLAVGANRAILYRLRCLGERSGWSSIAGFEGLAVEDGLRLYAAFADESPITLRTIVAAAPRSADRARFLQFALQQAPIDAGADDDLHLLVDLCRDADAGVAEAAARRAGCRSDGGEAAVREFLGSAGNDATRREFALQLAVELAVPLPKQFAVPANPFETALFALHAAVISKEEGDVWATADAHLPELTGVLLRAVLLAARHRTAWPPAFATFVAAQTTHGDGPTRRAAYRALATRNVHEYAGATLAGEIVFDSDYAPWW